MLFSLLIYANSLGFSLPCEEIAACWIWEDSQPGQGEGRNTARRETAG